MTEPLQRRLSMQLLTFSPEARDDWASIFDLVRRYEQAGIDCLHTADHTCFGSDFSAYENSRFGGRVGSKQPTGPDGDWLDPLSVISSLVSITSRIRFMTSVLLAPLRRPVSLAKAVTTIDVLSGGRIELGVGVGWQETEYEAAGLPFADRGAELDRTMEICRRLWTENSVQYQSGPYVLNDVHAMPKPVQAQGVPVWIGGSPMPATMRRLASYASGWIPWRVQPEEMGSAIDAMRRAVGELGRDASQIRVAAVVPSVLEADGGLDIDASLEVVPQLAAAGITDFQSMFPLRGSQDQVEAALEPLVAGFRERVGR